MSTEPYYQDDYCTIYHGNALEILPTLEFDCIITDPPYGTGYYDTDTDITASLLGGIECPMAVFGYPEKLVKWCTEIRRVPDEWVTWWPSNGACRGVNFHGLRSESECIAIFGPHSMHDLRGPKQRAKLATEYIGANQRGDSHGDSDTRHLADVWRHPSPGLGFQSHLRQHPNEKSLQVISLLVQGLPGGTVLDPFMGSGTTLRAAKDLGRKAIGIEIEERYCEIAAKRLAQEVLPL